MPDFIELDLTADAGQLLADGEEAIRAQAPEGWQPAPIERWILSAVARMAVEVVILAGRVPLEIFRAFGEQVLRIQMLDATAATATIGINVTADPAGRVLPAGSQFNIDGVAFVAQTDLVAAPSSTSMTGPIIAIEPGAAANGLTGSEVIELVSPIETWIGAMGLAFDGVTAGGADGETAEEYVDRLADELPTLSPRAILPRDFAILARRTPGVERATAIDNFIPPSTTGAERAVTVALADAAGEPVPSGTKTTVDAALQAQREVNFIVSVIDPTYTTIDVTFAATALTGYDPAVVETAAEQAVADFLDPARWGADPTDQRGWINELTVRRNDLFGVLYAVPGLRHVTTLTLAVGGGTLGTADVTLTGPAALTRPGAISGTVT